MMGHPQKNCMLILAHINHLPPELPTFYSEG